MSVLLAMALVRWMVPGGDGKAAILPVAKAAALSPEPPTWKEFHVLIRFQAQSFEQHPRCNIRGAADAADANTFAFELLGSADRLMNDQLIGKSVDETADGDEIGSADHRVGDGAAGDIADLDGPRN